MSDRHAVLLAFIALISPAQANRDLVDLKRIGHVSPQGRVQDQGLPVVNALIKAGSPAVPFLVSKLEDRSEIRGHGAVFDFWPRVEVGHVALSILCDFFTRADGRTPTLAGLSWDEILERQDQETPAWQVYENFVAKHGRAGILRKVHRLLGPDTGSMVWDSAEQCFRPARAVSLPPNNRLQPSELGAIVKRRG